VEDLNFARDLLTNYGPLIIGWLLAAFLLWHTFREKKQADPEEQMKIYQMVLNEYHLAVVQNTKVLERLATLIEERTARQERERLERRR
jgi:hypothetical protein